MKSAENIEYVIVFIDTAQVARVESRVIKSWIWKGQTV